MTPDYRLYLVTDRVLAGDRSILEIVEAACAGGATLIQLREKTLATGAFVTLARALIERTAAFGVPLVINDRADVALASGAAGLHVGQDDLDPVTARRLMGPKALIGLSVTSLEQAVAAEGAPVDYLGAGPIFPTLTKSDANPPIGLATLADIRRASRRPIVAIGGISADSIASVMATGVAGAAVVSAIVSAPDPRAAAAGLRARIDGARS